MVEVSLTVGKLDASLALLLTNDHHVIEFPTILLPDGVSAGSVVTIKSERDVEQEKQEELKFQAVQEDILKLYGTNGPKSPVLKIKNVTQTSAVLEWDPLELGSASLKSLSLYKNGSRLGQIPNPLVNKTTKLSGLPVDTPYEFYLKLSTTSGVYKSEIVQFTTHKMTDLSGIAVCLGEIGPNENITAQDIEESLNKIGAKPLQNEVRVDTTHFITTLGIGSQWKKALDNNIPVVRPEWLKSCEKERRIVGVRNFYLDADPKFLENNGFTKEASKEQVPKEETQAPVAPVAPVETQKQEDITPNDLEDVPLDDVEEPVNSVSQEPAEEKTKEKAEEPVEEEKTEKKAEEPIEEKVEEPVQEKVEEPVEENTEEPIAEKLEEKVEEPVVEPSTTEEPIIEQKEEAVEAPKFEATETVEEEETAQVVPEIKEVTIEYVPELKEETIEEPLAADTATSSEPTTSETFETVATTVIDSGEEVPNGDIVEQTNGDESNGVEIAVQETSEDDADVDGAAEALDEIDINGDGDDTTGNAASTEPTTAKNTSSNNGSKKKKNKNKKKGNK